MSEPTDYDLVHGLRAAAERWGCQYEADAATGLQPPSERVDRSEEYVLQRLAALREQLAALAAHPAQPGDGWIAVSERIPTGDDDYEVVYRDGSWDRYYFDPSSGEKRFRALVQFWRMIVLPPPPAAQTEEVGK